MAMVWMWRLDLKGAPARLRGFGVYVPLLFGLALIGIAIGSYVNSTAFRQRAVVTSSIVKEVHPPKHESKGTKIYGAVDYSADGHLTESRVLLESCLPDYCIEWEKLIGTTFEIAYDPHEVTRVVPAGDVKNPSSPDAPHIGMGLGGLLSLAVATGNLVLAPARPKP